MLKIDNSLCEQLNLTQQQLADELGISKRALIYRLDGEFNWNVKEIIRLWQLCNDDIAIESGVDTYSIKINRI